jgi:hypothetical protein
LLDVTSLAVADTRQSDRFPCLGSVSIEAGEAGLIPVVSIA